jgi:hypothetical protein
MPLIHCHFIVSPTSTFGRFEGVNEKSVTLTSHVVLYVVKLMMKIETNEILKNFRML